MASDAPMSCAKGKSVPSNVQPTVTFVYPPDGPTTEDTPIGAVEPTMRSGLVAEDQAARFAAAGRRGVVLRFGLLDGPGTGHDEPVPVYGSTLDVRDAGRALLSALSLERHLQRLPRGRGGVDRPFRCGDGLAPRTGR